MIMRTYKVVITEKAEMAVEVEAPCRYDTERLVERKWENRDYALDADRSKEVTFTAKTVKKERTPPPCL